MPTFSNEEIGSSVRDKINAAIVATDNLGAKADLDSPNFINEPTAPTQSLSNNSTRLATTAFVQGNIGALLDGVPSDLNTLDKIGAALGYNPDFASENDADLALKADKTEFDPNYHDVASSSITTTAMSGKTIRSTGGSTTTLTVAENTITRATGIVQTGTGTLTIAAGSNVTIHAQPDGTLVSAGQYAFLVLIPIGSNEFVLTGATVLA